MIDLKINPKSNKVKEIAFSYGDNIYFYRTKNGLSSTLFDIIPIDKDYLNKIEETLKSLNEPNTNTKELIRYLEDAKHNNASDSDILDFIASNGFNRRNDELDNRNSASNEQVSNRKSNSEQDSQDTSAKFSLAEATDNLEKANPKQEKAYNSKPVIDDDEVRYSVVTDKKLIDKHNSEETIKTYRSMQLIDGKLYPPMASRVNGDFLFLFLL